MGHMKDFDIRIRNGGDDAIAAVSEYVAEQGRLIAQVESMLQRACGMQWEEWIPVTEQMPDERAPYLLVVYEETGRQIVTSGEYEGDGHWTPDYNPMLPDEMVTHWMPLPAPPTDAK